MYIACHSIAIQSLLSLDTSLPPPGLSVRAPSILRRVSSVPNQHNHQHHQLPVTRQQDTIAVICTLTSPSEASRKATKQASRVMSSLKNTLWSTLSKTRDQHSKEQKPKYQLCSNPSITITDAETGEVWEFVDHDELDGDLANSDDNRTLREELEMNAREQEHLLYSRRWMN
ncbi:hypothetical protein DER46DRAFT_680855 [Fusarium sp. MPI-SDFR-AT-0072]|uniref:Uncharacterized protein n=1 Tax=Fusarium oxysporum f. sp. rapae TaxID=485398 RepID=A0A8J5P0M2_FUSOX|nr:hypothetical protein Forpe1208_v008515 [Fusarium oxysporum f. sp. rapae]KAH7169276.1 hypothetical protein DER46DRAFT_680855 [Fusarium sp. MPI-SDFR-AT-0072]KAI7764207.1 hypothetical protein LZL87_012529 [Fusarium oxysporum]